MGNETIRSEKSITFSKTSANETGGDNLDQ